MAYIQRYNSTLRIKTRPCSSCGHDKPIFSKGRCQGCARIEDALARNEKDIENEEGLPELISDADAIFSKYIRLKYADTESGMVKCYTCEHVKMWTQMQCGHYVTRGCLYLRWDERNCRPQDDRCNVHKRGNLAIFGQNLERENPGITLIMEEEKRLIHKPTREEIRAVISEYTQKLSKLKRSL